MGLTRLSVYRPVVALTVTVALVLFGVASYFSLGLEQNPQLKLPIVTVQVAYPGASAQTVEEQVTRPVEDAIAGLGNIKTLSSVSRTGLAVVTVEFKKASTSTSPPAACSSTSAAPGGSCRARPRSRAT
jgi:multidrug efflux pump subunit AcrB